MLEITIAWYTADRRREQETRDLLQNLATCRKMSQHVVHCRDHFFVSCPELVEVDWSYSSHVGTPFGTPNPHMQDKTINKTMASGLFLSLFCS